MDTKKAASWMDHLEELRKRVIISGIVILVITLISFSFTGILRQILLRPAGDLVLIYISPPEAFLASLRLAFMAGVGLSLPFIVYQVLIFFFPALYRRERRLAIFIAFFSLILFAGGVTFSYFIAFPFALNFFLRFADSDLQPFFTITSYISFAVNLFLAFGLAFQSPLIFWFLGSVGIVNPGFLRSNRKFALLILLVLATVITPPDVISQVMITIPLLALYELGIILVVFSQKKDK